MKVDKASGAFAARAGGALSGRLRVPGDKSLSHRALIVAGLARGTTRIAGLLESDDVLATAGAMRALGARISRTGPEAWEVTGCGNGALLDPAEPLDLGNAGTGARLIMGLVAGQGITATFTGDRSLCSRPMGRILTPLKLMGARVLDCAPDGRMPLTLAGSAPAIAIEYRPEMASAQVKSAVLLAGLNAIGRTTVVERLATRDHTERLLRHFGVPVDVSEQADGWHISVEGEADPVANDVQIAGDPSSAAFPLVAALLVPGSRVTAENVLLNEARSGLFTTLTEMGAKLTIENEREAGGERVADLRAEYAPLRGVEVPPERAPSMIDEYPVLAVAAAFADGATIMRGVGELRVKESDRLQAILDGLAANGVAARADGEDLTVEGGSAPGTVRGGGLVTTHMDHRIAMAFLVMGLASADPVRIDDAAMIATSFPGFIEAMGSLGADLAPAAEEPAS